jgi:hypothetical protein
MNGLHLIAHKVRGEPAFDIAIKMEMADGCWWIIPTSGHRAYPFWWGYDLERAIDMGVLDTMPADLPDHYPLAKKAPTNLDDLEID